MAQERANGLKDELVVRTNTVNTLITELNDEYRALHGIVGYVRDDAVHSAQQRIDERRAARIADKDDQPRKRHSIESAQSRAYNKSLELLTLAQDTDHDDRISRALELIRDALQDRIQRAKVMAERAAIDALIAAPLDDDDQPVVTNGHAAYSGKTRKL